jgi:SAM-dependent methyltransferase
MSGSVGGDPKPWYEDDELWITLYPFMFPAGGFSAATEEAGKIVELSGCSRGTVLDLCCGPGRHAIPLAKRGFRVCGVDRTAFLLNKAREYAAQEGAEIEWVTADMREFRRPEAFDLAISMFTSFGYFDDPTENLGALQNVFASLRPGGVFLVEVMGKEVLARIFQPTSSRELPGEGILVQRRSPIDDWNRMDNEWILVREGEARSFRIRHWIYSGQELRELLLTAGFAAVDLFGDLDGAAYGPSAARLIARARKS